MKPNKHRHSIFLKLLGVLAVTGISVNAIVIAMLALAVDRTPMMQRLASQNAKRYLAYLTQDLGPHPTVEAMRAMASDLNVAIRAESLDGRMAVESEALPSWSALVEAEAFRRHGPRIRLPHGRYEGRFFVVYHAAETRYLFYAPLGVHPDVREDLLVPLLMILSAVIMASFFVLKRLLRPVRELAEGVDMLAQGDLEHQVPVHGKGELAELALSFNAMRARVKAMLVAKEQLLLDVSHELRSPMTRAKVALELMDDPKIKRLIGDDLDEMERMTAALLESARLDSPHGRKEPLPVDLAQLAQDLTAAYPGVKYLGPEHLTGRADAEYARASLQNLLENALKYAATATSPVEVSLHTTKRGAELTVRDFGPGIPESELARVFEPFYRVDKSRNKQTGGFGLGLALTRKLMRAQGGDAELAIPPAGPGLVARLIFLSP